MTYLNLELIKNHLNLQNFSDDDKYLQHLGSAVEFVVERDIDKKLTTIPQTTTVEIKCGKNEMVCTIFDTILLFISVIKIANITGTGKHITICHTAIIRVFFRVLTKSGLDI